MMMRYLTAFHHGIGSYFTIYIFSRSHYKGTIVSVVIIMSAVGCIGYYRSHDRDHFIVITSAAHICWSGTLLVKQKMFVNVEHNLDN